MFDNVDIAFVFIGVHFITTSGSRGRYTRAAHGHASPHGSQPLPDLKPRGPNWIEVKMLVLIGQENVE